MRLSLALRKSPPPPTRSKRLRKTAVAEYEVIEEPIAVPTETSGTDEELREAFEAVKQEKEVDVSIGDKKKGKEVEEEEEIPAEIIAESIALAKQQQEAQGTELTNLELALFDDVEAEHSTAVPKPEVEAEHSIAIPVPEVEEDRIDGTLAVVTSPLKPPIVAVTSFTDPELEEFEAMDLDDQLDKLEKLSSTPGKAKSKAVDEVVDIVKIWQSTKLDLDESNKVIDQLMKDLDLLHRENMAPRPIIEISLGLAKDVLNLHNRYEDLKPSFNASEFCKATREANLAYYKKQKAELEGDQVHC
ncbi:unnamed protein product [Prunus armeniaca]